jgi:mono/diheme cytochrome c family protein
MYKKSIVLMTALMLTAVTVFAQVDIAEVQSIIQNNCTQCHTPERLKQAMRRGDNFDEIMTKMIRLGARIDSKEREVLGIFWTGQKSPIDSVSPKGKTVASDPLGEYRAILQRRCTGCHSLDIVEKAMMDGRSVDELVVMMRKRGAVVTVQEKSVLDAFWGSPFKEDGAE